MSDPNMPVHLGIEIGGTKLQLGVGRDRAMFEIVRADVVPSQGAAGILAQIIELGRQLERKYRLARIGVGFGGPVDPQHGRVTKSHQIAGWEDFPLANYLSDHFQIPAIIDNDCNVAALGEALMGAGKTYDRVFYVTVGTGIGGGFVVHGSMDGSNRPAIAEIGHLRPGLTAVAPAQTVESVASGWGITNHARRLVEASPNSPAAIRILEVCQRDLNLLTTKQLAELNQQRPANTIAAQVFADATSTLGWGIAQMVTLLAPDIIVVGGGVTLSGPSFLQDVQSSVAQYVFPPLAKSYQIVPAQLGEAVVVQGALLLAAAGES